MSWKDLDHEEKRDFWGWLVAVGVVIILALMVMTVYGALSAHQVAQAYEPPEQDWLTPYPPDLDSQEPR